MLRPGNHHCPLPKTRGVRKELINQMELGKYKVERKDESRVLADGKTFQTSQEFLTSVSGTMFGAQGEGKKHQRLLPCKICCHVHVEW